MTVRGLVQVRDYQQLSQTMQVALTDVRQRRHDFGTISHALSRRVESIAGKRKARLSKWISVFFQLYMAPRASLNMRYCVRNCTAGVLAVIDGCLQSDDMPDLRARDCAVTVLRLCCDCAVTVL